MLRLIRVILSADIDQFSSGMSRAAGLLGGFLGAARSAFTGAMEFAGNLVNTLAHLPDALNTITDGIQGFFGGALEKERATATFKTLTGSAEQAGQMMQFLREQSLGLGKDIDELIPSAQQVAVALKASDGAVDPSKWENLTMAIVKFSALRPDVPIQLWGRAISGLLNGDATTLVRALDIDVKNIQGLSDKVKDFLGGANEARDQQLGRVTKLGGDTAADRDTALQALQEILDAVGATDELLQEQANTTQGKLDRLKAAWEDFVDRVAAELLPLLTDALDKLLAWIDDHQAEIEEFLGNIGKLAQEAWDKLKAIDFEKIGKDLSLAGKQAEKDWEWFTKFLSDVEKALDAFNKFYTQVTGQAAPGTKEWADPSNLGKSGSLLGGMMGNGPVEGPIGQLLDFFANAGQMDGIPKFSTGGNTGTANPPPSEPINVNITLNTDMLAAQIEGGATNVVAQFVEAKHGQAVKGK